MPGIPLFFTDGNRKAVRTTDAQQDPPTSKRSPISYYRAGMRAARRLGYHVGDAENEVPHGWNEHGGPGGQGNGNPDTTTLGGGVTPGMKVDLVTSFPLMGARFIYVPVTDPNGDWHIFKKDMQSKNGMPEQVGGPYQAGDDAFLWSDQTSTAFRVWRTVRQRADNDAWSRGSGNGSDVQDRTLQALQDNITKRTMRDTSSQEYGVRTPNTSQEYGGAGLFNALYN